jgi:hypothetical protein
MCLDSNAAAVTQADHMHVYPFMNPPQGKLPACQRWAAASCKRPAAARSVISAIRILPGTAAGRCQHQPAAVSGAGQGCLCAAAGAEYREAAGAGLPDQHTYRAGVLSAISLALLLF